MQITQSHPHTDIYMPPSAQQMKLFDAIACASSNAFFLARVLPRQAHSVLSR